MKRVGLQEEAAFLEQASNRLSKKLNILLAGDDEGDCLPQIQLQVDLNMGTSEELAEPQTESSSSKEGD
jgi:hypothetical protein